MRAATGRALIAVAIATAAAGAAVAVVALPIASSESTPDGTVLLSALDGASTAKQFVLRDDTPLVTAAKFYLTTDGVVYLSTDRTPPFEHAYSVRLGPNSVQVRHVIAGVEKRVTARFVAVGKASPTATPTATPTTPPPTTPPPTTPPTGPPDETVVGTVRQLEVALAAARPGSVISLLDGAYERDGGDRWVAAADGTKAAPITLRGNRAAILQSDSPSGDYGLHVTGNQWRIEGLTVRNATKGIVLDRSVGTQISDVEVANIGDEGVHFRTCSSDGVLRDSFVHDTGVDSPQYGEGVYAGSANSNWGLYGCGDGGKDDTERTLVENNLFRDIPAEAADLKEGTDSGTVRGNTFDNVGFSGENSADSAVDAKGNNWLIVENR